MPPCSYTVLGSSLVLSRRKETAALILEIAVSNGRVKSSAVRRLFSFVVVRQIGYSFKSYEADSIILIL